MLTGHLEGLVVDARDGDVGEVFRHAPESREAPHILAVGNPNLDVSIQGDFNRVVGLADYAGIDAREYTVYDTI